MFHAVIVLPIYKLEHQRSLAFAPEGKWVDDPALIAV